MNISEVARQTELTAVTLRYYERVGLIPPIERKNGSVRNYSEQDLNWILFIKCMRQAGLSIESLIEYTKLFQVGEETAAARKKILEVERAALFSRYQELGDTIERLDGKITVYDEQLAKAN